MHGDALRRRFHCYSPRSAGFAAKMLSLHGVFTLRGKCVNVLFESEVPAHSETWQHESRLPTARYNNFLSHLPSHLLSQSDPFVCNWLHAAPPKVRRYLTGWIERQKGDSFRQTISNNDCWRRAVMQCLLQRLQQ